MAAFKRATINLEAGLHRALRLRSAETDQSISDLVNAAVRCSLSEDAADLAAFKERAAEPVVAFETVLSEMKRRSKL